MSNSCVTKELTNLDISNLLLNKDNPKSIYYYMYRLLDIENEHVKINWSGALYINIKSSATRVHEAVYMTQRHNAKSKQGSISFILDLFPHQILPKSRLIKIISRKSMPVQVPNPKAGQTKEVKYGYNNQFTTHYPEPDFISADKHFIMYTRNMWDRKTELKINGNNEAEEDAQLPEEENIIEEQSIEGTVYI